MRDNVSHGLSPCIKWFLYMGLCEFSWPSSLPTIERISLFQLVIIIKSKVWIIDIWLRLGHGQRYRLYVFITLSLRCCLPNRLFRPRSKKTSKLRVTGLCVGNSPGLVNSPHKGPVTRTMFQFDDIIMNLSNETRETVLKTYRFWKLLSSLENHDDSSSCKRAPALWYCIIQWWLCTGFTRHTWAKCHGKWLLNSEGYCIWIVLHSLDIVWGLLGNNGPEPLVHGDRDKPWDAS